MLSYTVHEPPNADADRADRAEKLEFVKDGFSWPTAIFPPLGFISNSMWLAAIAYIAGLSGLIALFEALKIDANWTGIIVTAVNVYLAFELSTLKRMTLDRQGWQMVGVVTGRSLDDCERRFLEQWLPDQPAIVTAAPVHAAGHLSLSGGRRADTGFSGSKFWPFGGRA